MSDVVLRELEPSPAALPETVEAFLAELGGPALLRVPGRDRSRTRAVVTLLHGNEPSGARAVHAWLRAGETPAVDALIVLGAVPAAVAYPLFGHRALPGARDLNRCFAPPWDEWEGRLAERLLARLREAEPETLIDVHNNSGHNPPYGVAPSRDAAELGLVSLFADRLVHNDLAIGALVEATHREFPSVAIECGRSGDPQADRVALSGLRRYLGAERLGPAERPMAVLTRPLRVRVRSGVRLAFGERAVQGADFTVRADIDRHNFETLVPGSAIGWLDADGSWPVEVRGADGADVSRELFARHDGVLATRRSVIPIMMTTDPDIALADCLCYIVDPKVEQVAAAGVEPPA